MPDINRNIQFPHRVDASQSEAPAPATINEAEKSAVTEATTSSQNDKIAEDLCRMANAAQGAYKETWKDLYGRKHRTYTVRSLGSGRGFGILETSRNIFVVNGFSDRASAWDYLKSPKPKHQDSTEPVGGISTESPSSLKLDSGKNGTNPVSVESLVEPAVQR